MKRTILAILLLFMQLGASSARGARPLPDKYPAVFQLLKYRFTATDWAKMEKFDVLALTAGWALHNENGNLDSLRAMRERNPDLVILMNVSCGFNCPNWGSQERFGLDAWAESLSVHSDDWILRDTDGDRVLLLAEADCEGGRLNFSNIDMARAYAHYVAGFTAIPFGDVVDGYRLDEVHANVHWRNAQPRSIFVPGVDSLDTNRDGVADTWEEVEEWWSAGVDTFITTLRGLIGDRYAAVNGFPPVSIYPNINGRFHQAFPAEEGRGWEFGMSDAEYGALHANELYSHSPGAMDILLADNYGNDYDLDPDHLSTKDEPFPHPALEGYVRFTLGSALVADAMYGMTGWGTAVDWNDEPVPAHYQTLWWFDIYDTLKTYIGHPVGDYTRFPDDHARDKLARNYTGGRVRVYPNIEKAIFDLRPVVDSVTVPSTVRPGEEMPVRWTDFDPNGVAEQLDVKVDLSRNGGATFPEPIGTARESDSLVTWTASGGSGDSCMVRITVSDTSGLADTAYSPLFVFVPAAAVTGGSAEIRPADWIVNLPEVACTLTVSPQLADSAVAGWNEAAIILPEEAAFAAFGGVESGGGSLGASYLLSGDTLVVTLDEEFFSAAPVAIVFDMIPPGELPEDSLRFEAGLRSGLDGDPVTWLPGGDADPFAGDGGGLSVAVAEGPAVTIEIAPAEAALAAGDTLRFAATARDTAGNLVEVEPVWSASDTLGAVDQEGLFRASRPGSMAVTATAGALADSASVVISAGAPAEVDVEPDHATVVAHDSHQFTATVRDGFGNLLDDEPTWSVTDSIGEIDEAGRFTATGAGTGVVRADVGGASDSATVEVLDTLADVALLPAEPVLSADSTLRFELAGITILGDTLDVTAQWSLHGLDGDLNQTGLFTPLHAGSGFVVAEAAASVESTSVTVVAGAPALLAVDGDGSLTAGDSLDVGAALFDQKGNAAEGEIAFRAEGPCAGGFTPPFRCTTAGEVSIIAESGSLSDTLAVAVGRSDPAVIAISPQSAAVDLDSTVSFTAESFDSYGNPVSGGWTFSAYGAVGSVDSAGTFTAAAPGEGGVVVAIGEAADTAFVTVNEPPPPPVVALTIEAEGDAYGAADWPAPWLFVADLHDTAGVHSEPDSLFVVVSFSDPSLAAPGFPETLAAGGSFPESLYVPMNLAGGCGELTVAAFTVSGLAAAPRTHSFATPDVDGSFAVDFGDVARLIEEIDEGGGAACDLSGDGNADSADFGVILERLTAGDRAGDPGDVPPRWFHLGSGAGDCLGESLSTRFQLYAEGLDSVRAVRLSFDLPPGATGVVRRTVGGWSDPLVLPFGESPRTEEWLVVNAGVLETGGGPIAEIVVCGAGKGAWSERGAGLTAVGADYAAGPDMEIEIEFQLETEDTTAAPDTSNAGDSEPLPGAFSLFPGRPNPFRDRTVIRYGLPQSAERVSWSIYAPNGRLVAERNDLPRDAGFHAVEWDGRDGGGNAIAPGAYFIRLRTPLGTLTRKLVIVR